MISISSIASLPSFPWVQPEGFCLRRSEILPLRLMTSSWFTLMSGHPDRCWRRENRSVARPGSSLGPNVAGCQPLRGAGIPACGYSLRRSDRPRRSGERERPCRKRSAPRRPSRARSSCRPGFTRLGPAPGSGGAGFPVRVPSSLLLPAGGGFVGRAVVRDSDDGFIGDQLVEWGSSERFAQGIEALRRPSRTMCETSVKMCTWQVTETSSSRDRRLGLNLPSFMLIVDVHVGRRAAIAYMLAAPSAATPNAKSGKVTKKPLLFIFNVIIHTTYLLCLI